MKNQSKCPLNTNDLPHTSIIIPVYNDQDGLDICLQHIQSQTVPTSQFEVLIVDNASSPSICIKKPYPFRHTLIICKKPGSYAARNAGIKKAKGHIIVFLDADCKPERTWLEKGTQTLLNSNLPCIVGGEVALTLSAQPTTVELYQYSIGFDQKRNIQKNKFSVTANLFVRLEYIHQLGYFNENLLSGGDIEWSWRAEKLNIKIIYCPSAVVHTAPRRSLRAAVTQARRIAGGRYKFQKLGLVGTAEHPKLAPRRTSWESILWLLTRTELSILNRLKFLMVASLLRAVRIFEHLRLRLQKSPERR
ncbi:glycosyltransferase [Desulfogranum marinum]|uniref:glycosyltransferase n=1 Tax=Desulfogranum marinum TaxID=453220 RepID=UPI00196550B6|nr:glycosyltransferase family 2 protein [Desulfogranum marinum]MBM9513274.1 glycosyltransferase family 2 protein [Desulfogranum marinum]